MQSPDTATIHLFEPDPDNVGWQVRPASSTGRFIDTFGDIRARIEGDRHVRLRIMPQNRHLNIIDTVHGGFTLSLIDQSFFIALAIRGMHEALGGSTIDTSTQFLAPVVGGKPIDVVVEILRETGRMVFMRGLVEQDGIAAVSFTGTIKKGSRPR